MSKEMHPPGCLVEMQGRHTSVSWETWMCLGHRLESKAVITASSPAYLYNGDASHVHLGGLNYTKLSKTEKELDLEVLCAKNVFTPRMLTLMSRVSMSWDT